MYRIMGKIKEVDSVTGFADNNCSIKIVSAGYEVSNHPYLYERQDKRLDWQIIYIFAGEAINHNDKGKEILKRGDILIFPPKKPRRIIFENTKHYWIHLTGKDTSKILKENIGISNGTTKIQCFLEYEDIFMNLIETLQIKEAGFENKSLSLYYEFLYLIKRNSEKFKDELLNVGISKAVLYIQKNLANDITLDKLSEISGLSKYYLCRKFKKTLYKSPMNYLEDIRIERAKELLDTTNLTISQIAKNVGYMNPLYFSRVFKKSEDICPTEYKKSKKE